MLIVLDATYIIYLGFNKLIARSKTANMHFEHTKTYQVLSYIFDPHLAPQLDPCLWQEFFFGRNVYVFAGDSLPLARLNWINHLGENRV